MKSQSPAHPDFNSVMIRRHAMDAAMHHRYNSLRAMRVHIIPGDAPSALTPVGGYSRAQIGIIAGASGFLPACTVERRYGVHDLATFTLDGMPVVRKSARKAYRASCVFFQCAHMAGMI